MVRLSDLLGRGPKKKQDAPQPAVATPPEPPPEPQPPTLARSSVELETLYERLLACVKNLFEQARQGLSLELSEAVALIAQLSEGRQGASETILSLVERHTQENYLYSHSVNVALLANHVGSCLGYSGPAVRELALAGLLLDIGMAGKAEEVATAPRKLAVEEWHIVSKHPTNSRELLRTAQGLSQEALKAIGDHHERLNGTGYPQGLHETAISEYAKILAVCDVYDALTHPRSYRKPFSPAQAIKMLIDGIEDQFDRRIVKTLVDELSIYPKGSLIKLSTDEIGTVELVHPEAPLRPVVLIRRNASGQELSPPRRVDLLEQPFLYIKEIVTQEP